MNSPNWVDTALKLKKAGISWSNLPEELYKVTGEKHGYDKIRSQLRRKMPGERQPEITEIQENLLYFLRKGSFSLNELSNKVDRGPATVLNEIEELRVEHGFNIDEVNDEYTIIKIPFEENNVHKQEFNGSIFRFGLLGDTQLCSKYQQLTYLNEFYDRCEKEEIDTVFHTGDLIDGEDLYRGHRYEVFKLGSDEQVDYTVEKYPHRKGITTKFITGNHDLIYYKKQGQDIGKQIDDRREDMVYLGQLAAYVDLVSDVDIYLLHPDGGPSYAISYRPQKIAAGFAGGEKPRIMALGHWHKNLYLFERNIHIFCTMCFQAQTPYLKRKGLMPELGGYIVETHIYDNEIKEVTSTIVPHYVPIEKDYKEG